jgi:hypothetical protein
MFILRQLDSATQLGADSSESLTNDYRQQITDVNPRYLLQLSGNGKFSSDYTQVAASGTFSIPLPQKYVTTNNLHMCLTSDKTIQITTAGANGTSDIMLRAGTNQIGVLTQCGPVTSITITNSSASTANIEWFLFELPNVAANAGWRDGSLATGVLSP